MLSEKIHLKDIFPGLSEEGRDPVLTTYLTDITDEMSQTEQMRPALLILPGGGYARVSTREGEPVAINFAAKGFRVFVLTYSTAPHKFPAALREVAAAIELIHRNCKQWAVDVARVAVMGFSAGGHLACHYSNRFDCPEIRQVIPESKQVDAAVLCYPVISGRPDTRHLKTFQNISGNQKITDAVVSDFSLENMVSEKTPPTFLWHTREDQLVPVANSLLYAQALAQQGIPFELHVYPHGPHGLATADRLTRPKDPDKIKTVSSWIESASRWLFDTL